MNIQDNSRMLYSSQTHRDEWALAPSANILPIAKEIHSSLQVEPRLVHDIHEYLMNFP